MRFFLAITPSPSAGGYFRDKNLPWLARLSGDVGEDKTAHAEIAQQRENWQQQGLRNKWTKLKSVQSSE
jgi:hypothetical protein